jgi:hypothetical protein
VEQVNRWDEIADILLDLHNTITGRNDTYEDIEKNFLEINNEDSIFKDLI